MGNSSSSKLNLFFSNLNVIIILTGYPLVTTIFIPLFGSVEGSTQLVTIPFRLFSLGITIITLVLNYNKSTKYSLALKLFIFFWILVLLRMFYDLEIRTDIVIPVIFSRQVWIFAVLLCFIPMISLIKSINAIDFDLCLKYIYRIFFIILIISYLTSVRDASSEERVDGNLALNTISYGLVACSASIISIYLLAKKNNNLLKKIIYVFSFVLGIYVAIRSGSKGPILGLILIFFLWVAFKLKSKTIGYFLFGGFLFILFVLKDFIIQLVGIFSPVLAFRFLDTLSGNDMSAIERQDSYLWFYNKIIDSPVYGSQFARLQNGEFPGYAHNIFLDILLGFGIIGLVIFLFVISKLLKVLHFNINNQKTFWIGLIMLQSLLLSLTSGAYYQDPLLNCSIVLTLLLINKKEILESEK
jgi:hypothetical protein